MRTLALLVLAVSTALACSGDETKPAPPAGPMADAALAAAVEAHHPFIAVHRAGAEGADLARAEALGELPAGAMAEGRGFYLAVDRESFDKPWFFAAFMKQYYQPAGETYLESDTSNGGLFYSLGSRVVSFALHAGKLFVFDRDPRKTRSAVLDPDVIVDAYPLVTGYAAFDRVPGSERYVLIDPAAGLSRFGVEASSALFVTDGAFTVDLAVAQRFRRIDDGITFEKLFAGSYTRSFANGGRIVSSRAAGTLGLAIRRYQEGEGFVRMPPPARPHYFLTRARPLPNEGRSEASVLKWNLKPGMAAIKWLVTSVDVPAMAPATREFDLYGAIKRGIESWNDAIGFPIFSVDRAGPDDQVGQDDKNFFIVHPDPRRSSAFADVRYNPNTGEIRGASVHFYSGFLDWAATEVAKPAMAPGAAENVTLTWAGARPEHLCDVADVVPSGGAATPAEDEAAAALGTMPLKERVERMVSYWAAHEVGHTLGLRHNFKGSLRPPSVSVMDYLVPTLAAAAQKPGSYDAQAVRFLYGLGPAPTDPFCTDSGVGRESRCLRHDGGSDPLNQFHGPRYTATLDRFLATGDARELDRLYNPGTAGTGYAPEVLSFLRVADTSAEAVTAWGFATTGLQPPIAPARLADRAYVARVDRMTAQLLNATFPDTTNPAALPLLPDPTLAAALAATGRAVVIGDGARGYGTRRAAVVFLRKLQHLEGLKALRAAREALLQGRAALMPDDQLQTDDLVARIDRALAPYFDE